MKKKKITFRNFTAACTAIILGIVITMLTNCKSKTGIPQLNGDKKYNLVLITIEGLRADRLGCYGFANIKTPNIDHLTEHGVQFQTCYSSVPLTLPSLCTLFTGRDPLAHGVHNNSNYSLNLSETTLVELFQQNGFNTHAVISSLLLLSKFQLNQGFNLYDDSLNYNIVTNIDHNNIRANKTYAKFKRWFDLHYQEPFFSWVHFHDPHLPYDPPADYANIYKNDPYSGEVSYVDLYVGKIIKDLEEKNLLNQTLIVLTSDYGEAFGEHNEFGHGIFCYNENLQVPLIFSNPVLFEKGKKVERAVGLIDVMPTLLHLYRIENPGNVQGRSIAHWFVTEESDQIKEASPPLYFESFLAKEDMNWMPIQGIISGSDKYIALPDPELYDLNEDRHEKENLATKDLEKTRVLNTLLQERIQEQEKKQENNKINEPMPGHLATSPAPSSTPGDSTANSNPSIDPRMGILLLNHLEPVKQQLNLATGDMTLAQKTLDEAVNLYAHIPIPFIYEFQHDILLRTGQSAEAEAELIRGIKLFPSSPRLQLKLAIFYLNNKQFNQTIAICQQLLDKNPLFTEASLILREAYREQGLVNAEMLTFFQACIDSEPGNAMLRLELADIQLTMGKNDEVKQTISSLMENDGLMNEADNLDLKTRMGMILLRLGEYDRTITLCLHILSQGHQSPQVLNQLGKAYSGKADFIKAEEAYLKALELDKTNDLTLSNLGTLYLMWFKTGKEAQYHARAVEFYNRALNTNPNLESALNGLAITSSFAGEPEKAVGYWQKTIEINPGFSNAYFNLGITYLKMNNKTNALKYLELCKERLYNQLSSQEQQQLDALIVEAKR